MTIRGGNALVAHGVPYVPPEAPTQEGIAGTDAGPGSATGSSAAG